LNEKSERLSTRRISQST